MIAIVAAYDKNRLIGKNGTMPWHIPGELKRFRSLTENNIVIMGRKTFDSLGKPLPGRINIVLTRKNDFAPRGCYVAKNITEAITMAKTNWPDRNIFIGGGADIYRQTIDMADILYITEIDRQFEGDTYFPFFDKSLYEKEINGHYQSNVNYTYVTYRKILSDQG